MIRWVSDVVYLFWCCLVYEVICWLSCVVCLVSDVIYWFGGCLVSDVIYWFWGCLFLM